MSIYFGIEEFQVKEQRFREKLKKRPTWRLKAEEKKEREQLVEVRKEKESSLWVLTS